MAYRRKARRAPARSRPARTGYRARSGRGSVRRVSRGGASRNTLRIELVQPGANPVARPFSLSENAPSTKPKGSKF